MGIFSKKTSPINYGEVNIATPAEHIVQMDSEQSLGTNVLKGYNTGRLTFGESQNLFRLVDKNNQELGLEIQSWGFTYPFLSFPTEDLYILCKGWIAFKVDKSNSLLWLSWLEHNHPK